MTYEETMTLNKGDLVQHKAGRTYRVYASHGITHDGQMVRLSEPDFIQQRNGKDYGPVRRLKPESIRKA